MQALFDGGKLATERDVVDSQPSAAAPDAAAPMCMISLDIMKAFPSLFQSQIIAIVRKKAPGLAYYVETMYGASPASIQFMREDGTTFTRPVKRGVLAGDPLGTFLMCLVLHEHVGSKMTDEFRDVITAIFADDHNAYLPIDTLAPFIKRFTDLLRAIGCKLQPAKSKVLFVSGTDLDRARLDDIAGGLGLTVVDETGLTIVGHPVGSEAFITSKVDELASKVLDQQRRIMLILNTPEYAGFPRLQVALTMMRLTGPSSFSWAARGLKPSALCAAARRVDRGLFDIFLNSFNLRARYESLAVDEQAYAFTRFCLSKTAGGLATGGCELALDGAYLGGLVALARVLKARFPTFVLSDLVADADAVLQTVRADVPAAKSAQEAHIDDLANGRRSARAVQHDVTSARNDKAGVELCERWGNESFRTACLVNSRGKSSAALNAGPRMLESRMNDAVMSAGVCTMLCLPQIDAAEAQPCPRCHAEAAANPREGGHAYLCSRDTAKQKAATACATAFIAVVQTLPGFGIYGPSLRASMTTRPAEPPFGFLRDNLGAVLRKPSDAERRADVGIRTAGGAWHAIDFKKVAAIQGGNLKAACAKQGAAVKAGDKGKISSYQLSISNFDALRHRIHMAVVDNHGTLSEGYDKLLKAIARQAYPGSGLLGKWPALALRCAAARGGRRRRLACQLLHPQWLGERPRR